MEREGYYAVVNNYKGLFIDLDAEQSAKGEGRYKNNAELFELGTNSSMEQIASPVLAQLWQQSAYHQNPSDGKTDCDVMLLRNGKDLTGAIIATVKCVANAFGGKVNKQKGLKSI